MNIAVLQHAACEGPGDIGAWAQERGHAVTVHHLYLGDALPEIEAFDLLVVMGGEMNIYQHRDYPWLKPESALIRTALAAGRRMVGICLGAQLIADALGARVTQNPVYEIGWWPVTFTPEGRAAYAALPARATVLHWHGDTFELPPGALRLARSEGCGEQGFVIAGKCLGLQFHLEMDPALVKSTVEGSTGTWPTGPFVQNGAQILRNAETYHETNRRFLFGLLDRFCGE
jgi:GMP synthase (glutamine-hydrolysing)